MDGPTLEEHGERKKYVRGAYAIKRPNGMIDWTSVRMGKNSCTSDFCGLPSNTEGYHWKDFTGFGYEVVAVGEIE